MAVRDEFGAGGLHRRRLPGVPEEADPVSLPQQLAADAQGRGKVAAGVERGKEEIRHHVPLKSSAAYAYSRPDRPDLNQPGHRGKNGAQTAIPRSPAERTATPAVNRTDTAAC